jgi:oligoribonuclease NrnB/cAMP/cGMP phosphodiesterase (DHH superfamily)
LASTVSRKDVYLFDHHKSAIPLAEFDWCEVDKENNRCGSLMFYDWLAKDKNFLWHIEIYKELVKLADDRDRWIKQYPESDTLSLLHNVLGQKIFIERFERNPGVRLTDKEQYIITLEESKKNEYIEEKKKKVTVVQKNINGHDVRIAFLVASKFQSDLGNSIVADPKIDADIAVMIGPAISLRSRQSCPIDLSVVAKSLGGGGHKNSGGCSLDALLELDKPLIDFVAEKMKWE